MTLQLTPSLEQRLEHLANQTHQSPHELAQKAMEVFIGDEEDLLQAVQEADEEFDCGENRHPRRGKSSFRKAFRQSMRIDWSKRALRELNAIADYIEGDSPQAAERVVTRIVDQVTSLSSMPGRGTPGRVPGTREMFFLPYPYFVV